MNNTPEQIEFADKLKKHPGNVPRMTARMLNDYLHNALSFNNCYFLFWTAGEAKFMVAYRQDRRPVNDEVLPFLQLLFDDGQIHEVGETPFSREFVQGSYSTTLSAADQIADLMANTAEKDSNAEAFDFERTSTGKRMLRAKRNGANQ